VVEKFESLKRKLNDPVNAEYVLSLTNSIHIKVARMLWISIEVCIERHAKRIRELVSVWYLDELSIVEFLRYWQQE